MECCYVIYSASLNRFYIGRSSKGALQRVNEHNGKEYGLGKFTAKATDWKLVITLECEDPKHSQKVEAHIKRMKSRKYIQNLVEYPELRQRLIAKHRS